jgi:4-amino-4-deoxy-L-arabinose transferase-like glycosyltransferase
MDNDSAHHANIALRMHLTGDYVNLIDYNKDYLDKPHLHFWLCALSYKIFGVTTFAYKLPSFLFTIAGTYATYRLGRSLYDQETGKLAALITASAFGYILANNDVRMDAILTSCIIISIWQLVEFVQNKKISNVVFAALALALGFSTKGHIAVFVPAVAILCYVIFRKEWNIFLHWKLFFLVALFAVFILPVVYCYYLQYNLHPEKIVRGKNNINGVQFILFGQSVERFQGDSFGSDSKNDYFFFLHSFLWAFAPWSILAYTAIVKSLKTFRTKKYDWLTTGVFVALLVIVSFSGFKLPHYLNIVFPTTAILTAAFLLQQREKPQWIKAIFTIQLTVSIILLLGIFILTFWAFPVHKFIVIVGVIALLSVFIYFLKSTLLLRLQKAVGFSVAAIALVFFLLNANFYPQLLKYQGGNELAFASKNKVEPENIYFWKDVYSSSFSFYTATLRKEFNDSVLVPGTKTWLLYDTRNEEKIKEAGFSINNNTILIAPDYEITKLQLKFINPVSRQTELNELRLAEITRD